MSSSHFHRHPPLLSSSAAVPSTNWNPFKRAYTPPPSCVSSNMTCNKETYNNNLRFLVILTIILLHPSASLSAPESDVLIRFKRSLQNTDRIDSWDKEKGEPCENGEPQWVGIICYKKHIWGLRLEGMHLRGIINIDCLKELVYLRVLSFQGNSFVSTMPEFRQLIGLKALFLSNNSFAGEIPDDAFANMSYLKKVHLANNKFIGTIPTSLADLPNLLELRIEGNQFEGAIPDFHIKEDLRTLNVSNNNLDGIIPKSLSKMDASAFQGNRGLCGPPLGACTSYQVAKKPSTLSIIIISIVLLAALIAIFLVIIILLHRKRSSSSAEDPGSRTSSSRSLDSHRLSFLREDPGGFELPDLLRASAEILGSGSFGASYKAALPNGPIMVVKRFKQLNNVGREEFGAHMRKLGRMSHPNVLPLVAYYYRKEEKLLIAEYCDRGSLAICLHGYQSIGQPSLDWPTRLKILKGVAKGLHYLYTELTSLITPHGHLKSSNVLINQAYEPLLGDYGLIPAVNHESAQDLMVAYKSPEYALHGRVTKKTDVWAFGILIIEVVTGRFPASFLHRGKGESQNDLVTWLQSKFHGEWTEEVIDKDMKVAKNNEGEIVKLLKLGIACSGDADKRLDMQEALQRIEEIKEVGADDDFFTTYGGSEGDVKSSRGLSGDYSNS